MVREFGFYTREYLGMDELFPSESSKQANLSADLSSLPPLNLTLRKTPSFLNLLKTKLSANDDSSSNRAPEKLKASNFPASLLRIGSWQEVSKHESDLVAKCYYSKKKLVWEVLKSGLKSKIEIQWSDISAIRATLREDQPGLLEVELDQAPTFYRESNPQPRKHTIWHMTTDFTDGQASLHRRHYIMFPPGVLDRHYEKLLQNDQRLMELSRKGYPSHDSPYFNWAPYEYHLSYSLEPSVHEDKPQIDFRCPPDVSYHQPIQAQQRAFHPTIHFDDSTVSPVSGPSLFGDNMGMRFSSSPDDQITGLGYGNAGPSSWGHQTTDFAEDPTFYGTTTTATTGEMQSIDMGMPNSFQQSTFHDPFHYPYDMGLNPAVSFQDSTSYDDGNAGLGAVQFGAMEGSSLPSQFNDESFTEPPFGDVFMYPPFSHGF
ncbi:hypothetical protein SAY87_004546 [Trapa incisa]|uniref:TRF2/HOY1 PH-like domain-containing protein n=1 Tax=Trapa incisa TaxID=236973 RepID=A0AAN7JP30_9MYRT|nr:hypothetical protein SAY87_004546 [Trapa incisa]